jgi:hypothetical protein
MRSEAIRHGYRGRRRYERDGLPFGGGAVQ